MLPFSRDAFFEVFARYNIAIWPTQLVFYALGVFVAVLVIWPAANRRFRYRLAVLVVAVMWAWTGVVYFWLFYQELNGLGSLFGALFLVQATGLAYWSVLRDETRRRRESNTVKAVGAVLMAYSLFGYPLVGKLVGDAFPAVPTFGVTPCSVTIFTLGTLILMQGRPPLRFAAIPLIWCIVGGSAAVLLNVPQDWGLPISALVTLAAYSEMRTRPALDSTSRQTPRRHLSEPI